MRRTCRLVEPRVGIGVDRNRDHEECVHAIGRSAVPRERHEIEAFVRRTGLESLDAESDPTDCRSRRYIETEGLVGYDLPVGGGNRVRVVAHLAVRTRRPRASWRSAYPGGIVTGTGLADVRFSVLDEHAVFGLDIVGERPRHRASRAELDHEPPDVCIIRRSPSDEPEVCGRRQVQGDRRDTRVVIRAIPRPASPVVHPSRGDDRLGGIDALYRDVLLRLTRRKIDPPGLHAGRVGEHDQIPREAEHGVREVTIEH